jgi:hypothetical protein
VYLRGQESLETKKRDVGDLRQPIGSEVGKHGLQRKPAAGVMKVSYVTKVQGLAFHSCSRVAARDEIRRAFSPPIAALSICPVKDGLEFLENLRELESAKRESARDDYSWEEPSASG